MAIRTEGPGDWAVRCGVGTDCRRARETGQRRLREVQWAREAGARRAVRKRRCGRRVVVLGAGGRCERGWPQHETAAASGGQSGRERGYVRWARRSRCRCNVSEMRSRRPRRRGRAEGEGEGECEGVGEGAVRARCSGRRCRGGEVEGAVSGSQAAHSQNGRRGGQHQRVADVGVGVGEAVTVVAVVEVKCAAQSSEPQDGCWCRGRCEPGAASNHRTRDGRPKQQACASPPRLSRCSRRRPAHAFWKPPGRPAATSQPAYPHKASEGPWAARRRIAWH
jgi:hypothetical protein